MGLPGRLRVHSGPGLALTCLIVPTPSVFLREHAVACPHFLHTRPPLAASHVLSKKERKRVKSLSHVRLFVTPVDCSLPGSSVHGILQARVVEWGAIAFSKRKLHVSINSFMALPKLWLQGTLVESDRI